MSLGQLEVEGSAFSVDDDRSGIEKLLAGAFEVDEAMHGTKRKIEFDGKRRLPA